MRMGAKLAALPSGIRAGAALVVTVSVLMTGCAPDQFMGPAELPPDVADPAATETSHGALLAYRGVLASFRQSVTIQVERTGVFGDELQWGNIGSSGGSDIAVIDSRASNIVGNSPYSELQAVRSQTRQAAGLALEFRLEDGRALAGHLAALEGYADVFLADYYCSGIPLSTIEYRGDWTIKPGSPTSEVYQHAAALFDSAITLAADSARILNLARVGKARALLGLGNYAEAAMAAAEVPEGFRYLESYAGVTNTGHFNFARVPGSLWSYTVADQEGGNGLDYVSSDDPRTRVTLRRFNQFGHPNYHPNKYATDGTGPIVLADWIEARLIEAEAALQADDIPGWLAKLNHLRQVAITPALPAATDPGTPETRVDLLFRERGFWLFLTGHRMGDMRRLIRQYDRDPEQVFPTGHYPGGEGAVYGTAVSVLLPPAEAQFNPLYDGCLSTGA